MDTMQIENVANPARDVEAIFSEIAQKNLKLIGFPPQVTMRHIKAAVLLRLNHRQTCDGASRFHIADFRCDQRHLSLEEWLSVYLSLSAGQAFKDVPCLAFVDDLANPSCMRVLVCRVKVDGSLAALGDAFGEFVPTPC